MTKFTGKAISFLAFGSALALGISTAEASSDQLTGCLTKGGTIIKLAYGDMPAKPCKGNQQQITLATGDSEPEPEDTRLVFVTSDAYDGNLGGISGADAICQSHADSAGRGGTFRAWLSDSVSSPDTDPTFYKHDGSYVRVDGAMIAASWDDLTDTTLLARIEVDETGGHPLKQAIESGSSTIINIWTNTTPTGLSVSASSPTPAQFSCQEWTSDSNERSTTGALELGPYVDTHWTQRYIAHCDLSARLYCFEQE